MKTTPCTEKKYYAFQNAPKCGAKARTNNYKPCRNPIVSGKKRCRMHGGTTGSGTKPGNQNAFKHGFSTAESKYLRIIIRNILKEAKNF